MSTRKPPKSTCLDENLAKKYLDNTNGSNAMFASSSASADPSASNAYPVTCRFCGGTLRAIDKHREDGKLTLQCRHRKCMRFNGLTADKQARQFLSEMAKRKARRIDCGWYLSDPVRHSYRIFASSDDMSDSEFNRSNVDVRPIIDDGNIMLRVFGQVRLVRLL